MLFISFFFFFKQKTAYEMRISDWSSDVCSSDLDNITIMKRISVLENFSEFPNLRHCSISDNSGEEFYHQVLNTAFKEAYEAGEKLSVNLDATADRKRVV